MLKTIKMMFSDKCEYAKQCPFYDKTNCDEYYKNQIKCGIKKEVDDGATWHVISITHSKRE